MALISYQDWMTRTRRGLTTPRSAELRRVDQALQQFHSGRTVANLINLRTAIEAWQRSKRDWTTSTRNLDDRGLHPAEELVNAVGTNPPAPQTPRLLTLTDPAHVANFCNAAKHHVHQAWTAWDAEERASVLSAAATDILTACTVPEPSLDLSANLGRNVGQFLFVTWTLAISPTYFAGAAAPNRDDFLEGAKTVYHESRHCEQWFHMARFACVGHQVTAAKVADQLGIPANIAIQAFGKPMRGGDPMLALTRGWFESVYSRSSRQIDLTALQLNRVGPQKLLSSFHARVHDRYARGLPEERDAWDCERLLDAVYSWP